MPADETMPPPPTPDSPPPGGYEFGEAENKVFAGLASKARGVGFWSALYGILLLMNFAYGCLPKLPVDPAGRGHLLGPLRVNRIDWTGGVVDIDLGALITGLVFLLLGLWSRGAASGFDAVAKTRGGDVGHLMGALKELSKLYGFLGRLIFLVVLVVTLAMIVVGVGLFASSMKPGGP